MGEPSLRQARYADRRRAAGLVQIATWVPASRAHDVVELAEILREESGTLLPLDRAARAMDRQLALDLGSS